MPQTFHLWDTHTHALDESSRKLLCDRVVFTTLLPLSTWIMTSHRVKMTIQKQSQAGTELCTRWNILFSLDHKKTGGKLPLRLIGSNPYSKWGYCTHWVRMAVTSSSKLLKTLSNLSLSLLSNNSWPFPCVPIAFTQGQLSSDVFVVLQAVVDHIVTPSASSSPD